MSQLGYLIIAISILGALLVIFIVSFVLYRRTPAPKGCEDIRINEENCAACGHTECKHYQGGEK
ncbi:MAG: hypothetical protein J6X50_05065 [Bacilli bacterium]|nr:hypothetical protein [Bacilli bacterium]